MAGQQPTLSAATLTGADRDAVCREALGDVYSTLSTARKAQVDVEGNAAFYEVTQWGRWYAELDPTATDLPSEWNEAFRALWVAKCKRVFRSPQDYHIHYNTYVGPLLQRIADHYTLDWNSATVLADDSVSPLSIRKSVIALCVRQRTPVFPVIQQLDTMIREEFVKLWNTRQWEFRKRAVSLTINTNGTITVAGGYQIDSMASKHFVIKNPPNGTRGNVEWCSATEWAHKKAAYDVTKLGIPRYFYDQENGDTKTFDWIPMPDQAYTAIAVINITAPSFGGTASSTTGISMLPPEFRGNLRDMVFAKCLGRWGREDVDATRAYNYAVSEQNKLFAEFDDKGASRSSARPGTQARWVGNLMSSRLAGRD